MAGSLWRRVLFSDAGAIVRAGARRPLLPEDAPPLGPGLEPQAASARFDQLCLARFWPFILRLVLLTGAPARGLAVLTVVRLAVSVSTPVLLHAVLERLPSAHAQASWPSLLLLLAVSLGLAGMLGAIATQHWYYNALRARTIIVNAVNRRVVQKALRLRRSARAGMHAGDLVNHLSSDADALGEAGFFLPELFHALLAIALAFSMLAYYLGVAALAAVLALLLLLPLTVKLAARFRALDAHVMGIRDRRVSLMSQILSGIRVVKFSAWEPSMRGEVADVRQRELRTRMQVVITDVFSSGIWVSTSTVVAVAGFLAFVALGGQLDAPLVFACIALFGMLEEPFGMITHILARLEHARVASQRLAGYFAAETRQDDERPLSPPLAPIGVRAEGLHVTYPGANTAAVTDATLAVAPGEAVAIVGPVGAGKSTLLRVLAEIQKPSSGCVAYDTDQRPRVGYVPQEAFILNASVRDNIVFGEDGGDTQGKDGAAAIAVDCALGPDLAAMPMGLETEIGERGVNLSGGQKQRVALARAAFHRPGIVFLDDPLSAVDTHTEVLLCDRILFGRWRAQSRVVVTHRLAQLPRFDRVVFVVDGRIVAQGSHAQLMRECPEFARFAASSANAAHAGAPAESDAGAHDALLGPAPAARVKPGAGRVTEDEDREIGAVQLSVYRSFLRAMVGSVRSRARLVAVSLVLATGLVASAPILQRFWFARFSDKAIAVSPLAAVAVYGALGLGVLVAVLGERFLWLYRATVASRTVHDQAFEGVLRAPLRFFDSTPAGRILNRFARDLESVDDELSWSIEQSIRSLLNVIAALALIVTVLPALLLVAIPVLFVYDRLQRAYRRAAREAKRMESIARSPRYAHFKELVSGLDVIHGFARERFFMQSFYAILAHYQRMHWCSILLNRWFSIRVPLVGGALALGTSVAVVFVARGGGIGAGAAGLVLSYALSFWSSLNMAIRSLSEVESRMTSAERLQRYARLAPEPETTRAPSLPDTTAWPTHGALELEHVCARYADHLPRVLDGVSFDVPSGARVALIGRTGAGKSTLFQALFRFIELEAGAIRIDGVDIATVPLPRLRQAIAIIPQDPTLFAGSVRANLDRFARHTDEDVWRALRRAHLESFVRGLPGQLESPVSEHGSNFSQGQRQLMCLARAILTRARIVVLDEATASVDLRTDELVQRTVRTELAGVTVIVIAHRLDTVAGSDLMIELERGKVARVSTPARPSLGPLPVAVGHTPEPA